MFQKRVGTQQLWILMAFMSKLWENQIEETFLI
jgi:hypothetical protein